MKKISIIIPAYNEEKRIGKTLQQYLTYFRDIREKHGLDFECVVVLNGCTDTTYDVVKQIPGDEIIVLNVQEAGKGLALIAGFNDALKRPNDLIGFVDADMATQPHYFYDLVKNCESCDGVIASRYMKESVIYPPRPFIKEWGRKIVYNSLARLFLGLSYYDLQCGAKLFTRNVVATITPHLTVRQWASDVEILYLCKKFGFTIKEHPTVWYDQADSKLKLRSGLLMLKELVALRFRHAKTK